MSEAQVVARLEHELEIFLGSRSVNGCINPLLGIQGLDIHWDTPTEILHTILLGVVKYFWAQTAHILDKVQLLKQFQIWLESIEKDGLDSPTLAADYIVRYKGGLIGKHFKSLAQVMPYLVHGLVPQSVLDGWVIIGRLVVLLWHTSIQDTESYLVCNIHFLRLYPSNTDLTGQLVMCHQRLSQYQHTMCTKHFGVEAKISLLTSPPDVYQAIWPHYSLLN